MLNSGNNPLNDQKKSSTVNFEENLTSNIDQNMILHTRIKSSDLVLTQSVDDPPDLNWIVTDPDDPNVLQTYPEFKYAHPIHCTLYAGDVLYIPAMWYHQVSQNCLTIAVNYWYEQIFDFRYVFYQTIQRMKSALQDDDIIDDDDHNTKNTL